MPARARMPLAAVMAALLLALTGCQSDAQAGSSAEGVRLAEVEIASTPRDLEGPSTAVLPELDIEPVTRWPDPELPATVTDAQGTQTVVHDVSRILALDLHGTLARTVFELGLGENVVGRDTSSSFPEIADRPLVTANGHQLNAEAILELGPSVIITDTTLGPWDVLLQMREAGIPVVVLDAHRSVDNAGDLIRQVAGALGLPGPGAELAERTETEIAGALEEIAAIAPTGEDRLRMLFLYARGQANTYYLFGTGSGADQLIEGIGGIDVATEIGWQGMQPMTDEALISARPDLVIMMTSGLESVGGVDGLLTSVPALALTPAGEQRRVVDMADAEVLAFGPLTAGVLEAMAVAAYSPAALAEVAP
ncbi:heme/hemin ABC transporter substrate-binding protein [Bogoriella caseilytica]|uniref:Iron complex transport system substrate-binding protein n=1 Tax=Bogoriella caseilytica TaxID=56055 RepID=A0A3N2BAM8_9MICO|nr:ABC transporter substrate-binding protein [Bogoriella caseilytica]ROR72297.1 iron complex transport system substrate-binding protein [Bogoriella caseilytica]